MKEIFTIIIVLMAFVAHSQTGTKGKDKAKTSKPEVVPQEKPREAPQRRARCCNWFAAVKVFKSWGYIDTNGVYQVNLQFDDAGNFSDGLARVRKSGDWGFIDTKGSYAINPQFDLAQDFSEDLARVYKFKKWGIH